MNNRHTMLPKLKNFLSDHLSVIFAYLLLALFFTFPLISHLADSIPGGSADPVAGIWYFWFFKHTLVDLGTSPFVQSDLLFYPDGFNISTGYDTLLAALISIPIQFIFKNLITVYNAVIIFNFVFSSYAAYLLIKHLTDDKKISFIAGVIFGFSPYMLARGLGHMNLLTSGGIPLFIFFFLRSLKDPSLKNSSLLAISFLLTSLGCWQYGLFTMLFIFFSLLFLYFTSRSIIINKRFLKNFVFFLALSMLLVLPFAMPMISSAMHNKMSMPGSGDAMVYSADLLSYIIPAPSNTLIGQFVDEKKFNSFSGNVTESTTYLGIFEIAFIFYFFYKLKKNKMEKVVLENIYWIFLVFIFFLLSLGSVLKINGYMSEFILPYYFLYTFVPFFNFAKEPVRLSIFVLLFTTIIFSVFLKSYLDQKKLKTDIILALILLIVMAERITIPYEIKKIEIPVFYNQIAKEKNDYRILDLPANIGWTQQPIYIFYQATHQKNIILGTGGYTSFSTNNNSWIKQNNFVEESRCYHPKYKYEQDPKADETTTAYDKNKLLQNFKNVNIKYAIIHKDVIANLESYGFDCQKVKNNTDSFFQNTQPVFEDEQIIVYQL